MLKKYLLSIFLGLIVVLLFFVSASAYSLLGDVDLDSKVTAADARVVLRLSVGLEGIQDYNFYLADIDGDKKISASDARQILRISVGLEKQIEHIHDYQNGTCTMPKTCSKCGISEGNAVGHSWKGATCTVPKTCSKCGAIEGIASGHNWKNATYAEPKTCTVCGITEGDKLSSENQNSDTTDIYYGITVTKLPYTSKGLTINSISFSGTKVTINVTNNTGFAVSGSSNFSYKCYDSNGSILKTSNIYLEDMNNGESCNVYFYAENNTSKIIFGEAKVYNGTATTENETDIYYGITVTKLPYTSKGLTINSISFSGTKVTINVTNNTGFAVSGSSNFSYKCYDSNGIILKTSNIYLEDMNNGESCNVYFYAENNTSKIIFGEAKVYDG